MGYAHRQTVNVTTEIGGAATAYTEVVRGEVVAIVYVKTDFAAGVDFAITTEETEQNLWTEANVNASKTVNPRAVTHGVDGVAALYAAGGTAVLAPIYACGERIKIAITNGGDAKVGVFHVVLQ